jgi:hypothetical protein
VLQVPFITAGAFKLSEERNATFSGYNATFRPGPFNYTTMTIGGLEPEQAARDLFQTIRAGFFAASLMISWGVRSRDEVKIIPEGSSLYEVLGPSLVDNTDMPLIYQEGQDLSHLRGKFERGINIDKVWPKFVEALEIATTSRFATGALADARVKLAFELYVDSHFELSDSACFLGVVGVLEVLKDKTAVSETALELIKEWREDLAALEDDDEANSIRGSLNHLMSMSISRGISSVVKRHLGLGRAREATELYRMRSDLVHDGKRLGDPWNDIIRARQLVVNLLAHILMSGSL